MSSMFIGVNHAITACSSFPEGPGVATSTLDESHFLGGQGHCSRCQRLRLTLSMLGQTMPVARAKATHPDNFAATRPTGSTGPTAATAAGRSGRLHTEVSQQLADPFRAQQHGSPARKPRWTSGRVHVVEQAVPQPPIASETKREAAQCRRGRTHRGAQQDSRHNPDLFAEDLRQL